MSSSSHTESRTLWAGHSPRIASQVTVMSSQVWEPPLGPHKGAADREAEPAEAEGPAQGQSLAVAKAESVSGLTVSRTELFPAHPTACSQFIHENLQHIIDRFHSFNKLLLGASLVPGARETDKNNTALGLRRWGKWPGGCRVAP